jgi:hypothetical protein
MADNSLLIDNFQKKVNLTYLQEFSKVCNVDVDTVSGVAMVNYKLEEDTTGLGDGSFSAFTFTANPSNDSLTTSATHGYVSLLPVTLSTTGTLPTGLSVNTTYYIITELSNTVKLASTIANAVNSTYIDFSTAGSGTHTITPVSMGYVTKIIDRNSNSSDFNLFAIDSKGKIWTKYSDGIWTVLPGNTNINARDIIIYQDYLLAFGLTKISVFGKLSDIIDGTPAWINDWQTFLSSITSARPAILGQDDAIYIGNGNVVASIIFTGTFVPSDGGTFAFNNNALDLPDNYQINCFSELGTYLVIGTQFGYNFGAGNVADVILWDRVSTSYELPVKLNTQGVRAMVNYNNTIYVFAGLSGHIYATDGTSARLVGKISPQMLDVQQDKMQLEIYRNGVAIQKDKILIGAGEAKNGYPVGVFSYNPQTGGIALEYSLSTGNDGSVTGIDVYSVYSDSDNTIYVGWQDGTTYGIDKTSNTIRYETAYIITGLYRVAQNRSKRVFSHFEIDLSKDLETENAVNLYYREKLNENFKPIGEMTSGFSKIFDKSISVESIQIKIELKTSDITYYSPELVSVRLI